MTARINLASADIEATVSTGQKRHAMGFRDYAYTLHMWLGIAISLYLCAMSCTGVILVFKEELETCLTNRPRITQMPSLAPLSKVIANVEQKYSGQQVSGIIYALEPDRPMLAYVLDRSGTYSPVLVNQYNAEVLGAAQENEILKFLQEAHHNLLFKKTGRKVNAIGGILLATLALSGIGLFLRGVKYCVHTLKMRWKGSPRVIAWSMHQQIGFFLMPALLIWGISGFSFGFRPEFERALNVILPVAALSNEVSNPALKKGKKKGSENKDRIMQADKADKTDKTARAITSKTANLDRLLPIAAIVCPDQKVVHIATAINGEEVTKLWLTNSSSLNKSDNTEVDIEASSGKIVSISRPEKRSSGDFVLMWLPRLHFGNFGGVPIKMLWTVIGLSPMVLSITGLMMWWNRRRR